MLRLNLPIFGWSVLSPAIVDYWVGFDVVIQFYTNIGIILGFYSRPSVETGTLQARYLVLHEDRKFL